MSVTATIVAVVFASVPFAATMAITKTTMIIMARGTTDRRRSQGKTCTSKASKTTTAAVAAIAAVEAPLAKTTAIAIPAATAIAANKTMEIIA